MFEQAFATLFRAVDRVRKQFETADEGLRRHLAEELLCIQQLGERYIDDWMALDEQIGELLDTYVDQERKAHKRKQTATAPDSSSAPLSRTSPIDQYTIPTEETSDWLDMAFDMSNPSAFAFRKGLGYYDLFMFNEAVKSFEQSLDSNHSPLGRLYLAASHAAQNHYDEAFRHVRLVRENTKEPLFIAGADELEAMLHLQLGNAQTALTYLEAVVRRIPGYKDGWFNVGVCYLMLHEFHEAHQALHHATTLEEGDVEAWRLKSYAQFRLRQYTAARDTCLQALNFQPLNLELLQMLSLIEHAKGNSDACLRVCQRMLELNPHSTHAIYLQAFVYAKRTELDTAVAVLKKRISMAPDDSQALLQLGLVHLLCGDVSRSEEILMQCFPTTNNKTLLWIALGTLSSMCGHESQAKSRFQRAMRDPRKSLRRLAMYQYAKGLIQDQNYHTAENYLKTAALLGEPNSAIYEALATCAEKLGHDEEARKWLNQAKTCEVSHH